MKSRIIDKLLKSRLRNNIKSEHKSERYSRLRHITSGSHVRISDLRNVAFKDISESIQSMRSLATDSQVSTVLAYYATDCTTANSDGHIIWATSEVEELADIVNQLFSRWRINRYARDHILELATIGNLYIPTSDYYKDVVNMRQIGIALDHNTIVDENFDIYPSHKLDPENILHVWEDHQPSGYIVQEGDNTGAILYPESSVIHFSLGGLVGDYSFDLTTVDGNEQHFDVEFSEPLLSSALVPTQILNLLEDASVLSSLSRVVRFVNVDCSDEESESEIIATLNEVKDMIDHQFTLNTRTGDSQSYINPQTPNNFVYLPKVRGQDAISITDLNMSDASDAGNALLEYFQNKKLSVLGIPKEDLNFSSSEGLGTAGTVMSQRSAIYANALTRIMTAYKDGWTDALNKYFELRGYSGYIGKFTLHMNPIVTTQSTIQFDKRDSTLSQATTMVELLKSVGVSDTNKYADAITEILSDSFPSTSGDVVNWDMNVDEAEGGGMGAV